MSFSENVMVIYFPIKPIAHCWVQVFYSRVSVMIYRKLKMLKVILKFSDS